jgi:drug/metabolite transporter (DMT)-like permease
MRRVMHEGRHGGYRRRPKAGIVAPGSMSASPSSVQASAGVAPAAHPLAGILLIIAAGFLFTVMDATAKYLGEELPLVEVAWGRYLFHALTLPFLILRFGGLASFRSNRLGLQLWRSVFLLGSTVLFWLALKFIPLAEATAVGFVGPLMLTALSVPFLGEKVGPRRWAAVGVGFVGALIIIRPGPAMAEPAALIPLASAAVFAGYAICTRILSRSDGWVTTLIWSASVGLVLLSVMVPFDWQTPDLFGWIGLAFLGCVGSLAHLLLILAYARAPASTLAPLSYLQLIWSTVLGLALFGNFPDAWTFVGGAIVAASGLYVIHRERLRRRESPEA